MTTQTETRMVVPKRIGKTWEQANTEIKKATGKYERQFGVSAAISAILGLPVTMLLATVGTDFWVVSLLEGCFYYVQPVRLIVSALSEILLIGLWIFAAYLSVFRPKRRELMRAEEQWAQTRRDLLKKASILPLDPEQVRIEKKGGQYVLVW